MSVVPGSLLLTPPDVGDRAHDVLLVFDEDHEEPGAVYALVLNRPTEAPAQPLALGLFDCNDQVAWWGGPTNEPFALVELQESSGPNDDTVRPDGRPRPFVAERVALFLPGRDHAPDTAVRRVRLFTGSVWLASDQVRAFEERGIVVPASRDVVFDDDPTTLASRLRQEGAR